ncbi:MAG: methyltransferase domain [Barrevirus sp.]|uniref:Small RNA 2'-O-methyltransferase n=1 Tax=Barrevirus sp. TaxID=2487763 RepID=A0A3G4ZQ13_9VIRU|nr:MAG: methyltransferase domain [Barrevirus sp.]
MCLIKLKSDNPKLSYILYKNPESGMQLRSIRQGHAFGFYTGNNNDKYIIYFRDGPNEMSYKEYRDQHFEYLNKLRYTSPIFVLNAISEFLNASTNAKHADDIDNMYTCQLTNISVTIDNHTLNILKRLDSFFTNFKIEVVEKAANTYKVKIVSKKSLYLLLNFSVVYFTLISMLNSECDLDMSESLIEKLCRCINIIDAPYYIRYVVNSRIITNSKLFTKFRPMLQKENMVLNFGNTAIHRRTFIREMLAFDNDIIDYGCGSGFYTIPFAQKLAKVDLKLRYYAIDINEHELFVLDRKLKENEIANVFLANSHNALINHLTNDKKYDIIISEVIEHNEIKESQEIIRWLIHNVNFNKIFVTTPNKEFNVNYSLGSGMRHEDHKWELTTDEFKKYVEETLIGIDNLNITYLQIGDKVNSISCSQGILIQRKN